MSHRGAGSVLLTHDIQSYFLDNCWGIIVPGNTQIVSGVPPGHLAQLQDRTMGLILTAAVLEVDGPPVRSPPGDAGLRLSQSLAEHPSWSSAEEPLLALTCIEENRWSHNVQRHLLRNKNY